MGRPRKTRTPLPTIWRTRDALRARVEPILPRYDPPMPRGRKRIGQRAACDALIFRLRTGCQGNRLPAE